MLTCWLIASLENVSYIVFYHVYYTSNLDIVSYPLVALCGMIVTLLDSSVVFLLMGYLCLFLPQGLTYEYIISIFIF